MCVRRYTTPVCSVSFCSSHLAPCAIEKLQPSHPPPPSSPSALSGTRFPLSTLIETLARRSSGARCEICSSDPSPDSTRDKDEVFRRTLHVDSTFLSVTILFFHYLLVHYSREEKSREEGASRVAFPVKELLRERIANRCDTYIVQSAAKMLRDTFGFTFPVREERSRAVPVDLSVIISLFASPLQRSWRSHRRRPAAARVSPTSA